MFKSQESCQPDLQIKFCLLFSLGVHYVQCDLLLVVVFSLVDQVDQLKHEHLLFLLFPLGFSEMLVLLRPDLRLISFFQLTLMGVHFVTLSGGMSLVGRLLFT